MDPYVTGAMIRRLREARGRTQAQLAERLCVSDKTVSKWETGRGYPVSAAISACGWLAATRPGLLSRAG